MPTILVFPNTAAGFTIKHAQVTVQNPSRPWVSSDHCSVASSSQPYSVLSKCQYSFHAATTVTWMGALSRFCKRSFRRAVVKAQFSYPVFNRNETHLRQLIPRERQHFSGAYADFTISIRDSYAFSSLLELSRNLYLSWLINAPKLLKDITKKTTYALF